MKLPEAHSNLIKELLYLKAYPSLYEPQEIAIEAEILNNEINYIIIAPTSTGKTLIAELSIYQALKKSERVLYIVPSKAQIIEKLEEFRYLINKGYYITASFGYKVWQEADLIVLTYEQFYTRVLKDPKILRDFDLAITDEFHLLYDSNRGITIEKSLILLREYGLRIICLSATFEDKNQVADWLDANLVTIPDIYRKIKLEEEIISLVDYTERERKEELFRKLIMLENNPYLIFCYQKKYTISRAKELKKYFEKIGLHKHNLREIMKEMTKIVGRELTGNEEILAECLSKGIAFHNSLLDDKIKPYVEDRFVKGKIDFLFSTTTLAYGFNSPAKSVVIYDTTRWNKKEHSYPLPVYEYIQMIGRAGRPQYYDK